MAFERVCALSEVPENGALRVELADIDIAVVRFEGEVYAVQDVCSHAEVPLSEGDVEEFHGAPTIECWLHGSCFDLRTGEPTNLPATEPVDVFTSIQIGLWLVSYKAEVVPWTEASLGCSADFNLKYV
jgi:3-phenylpropionate/trans-cinnamate dioxygenase ferredoxin subunit